MRRRKGEKLCFSNLHPESSLFSRFQLWHPSPCQLAGLERALLSVALAMLTKGTPVIWTTKFTSLRYVVRSRYVAKAT